MVIHDETRVETWKQERVEQTQRKSKPQMKVHLSVMGVQCIACVVMLLAVLLLRVAGGETYETLRLRFQQALARNELATAIALLWEDSVEKSENESVKLDGFTGKETAQLSDSSKYVVSAMPLEDGILTSSFGERIHPINGGQEFHAGVDIAACHGAPLMAIYDGEVVEMGEDDVLGRYIRMRHSEGIEIVYGHCEQVVVRQGDWIKAGDKVALVGSTGESTGNHVHLSVIVNGEPCNPADVVSLESYA